MAHLDMDTDDQRHDDPPEEMRLWRRAEAFPPGWYLAVSRFAPGVIPAENAADYVSQGHAVYGPIPLKEMP